jgi:hypothetical protein
LHCSAIHYRSFFMPQHPNHPQTTGRRRRFDRRGTTKTMKAVARRRLIAHVTPSCNL